MNGWMGYNCRLKAAGGQAAALGSCAAHAPNVTGRLMKAWMSVARFCACMQAGPVKCTCAACRVPMLATPASEIPQGQTAEGVDFRFAWLADARRLFYPQKFRAGF